ncbi:MAG: diguanylate cyclase [Nitrospinae bacterium]|nr:diguanylate cyclase [Nitrospinota bacterium]
MVKKILLVEDSKTSGFIYKQKIEVDTEYKVDWALTLAEAKEFLDKNQGNYFAGVLDFNLPDSMKGEIIDEVVNRDIPSIVFTGLVDEEVRNISWSKRVVDYIPKGKKNSINDVISLIKRLEKNKERVVLVVDDSKLSRTLLVTLLKVHQYTILEAESGHDALEILQKYPEVKLIITDAIMEGMDGFELTEKVRDDFSKEELAIIGISSQGKNVFAAKFIKAGANDFLIKQTFLTEEFYCRVHQSIEALENIQKIKEAAVKDFLTGLHNRRYFFDAGKKIHAHSRREKHSLCCCMIDIDYFKKVNDNYGHEVGDIVLKHIATTLQMNFRETDIVARFGGEEFCILAVNIEENDALRLFENIRKNIEETEIELHDGTKVQVTISAGIFSKYMDDLNEMVKESDQMLYKAKETGRNKIVMKRDSVEK